MVEVYAHVCYLKKWVLQIPRSFFFDWIVFYFVAETVFGASKEELLCKFVIRIRDTNRLVGCELFISQDYVLNHIEEKVAIGRDVSQCIAMMADNTSTSAPTMRLTDTTFRACEIPWKHTHASEEGGLLFDLFSMSSCSSSRSSWGASVIVESLSTVGLDSLTWFLFPSIVKMDSLAAYITVW